MKKFKFSLDSVLSYKEQVLEALQGEHAVILAQVREQEEVLAAAWREYRDCDAEYSRRKAEGIAITDAMVYQNGLRVLISWKSCAKRRTPNAKRSWTPRLTPPPSKS